MKAEIIKQVAEAALPHTADLFFQLFPNGKRQGDELCIGSLDGDDGDSLKINRKTGQWCDFASGEKGGGDIVSLWARKRGCKMSQAAEEVAEAIGFSVPAAKISAKSKPKPKPTEDESDGWEQVIDPPEDCDAAPIKGTAHYYHTADGRCLFCIERFAKPDGKKSFVPWTLWGGGNGPGYEIEWRQKGFTAPRPLYNLHKLTEKPGADVVVVEGEKCADALQALFPEIVIVTWAGGANATGKTDFEPLRGRKLLFWPDNDDAGEKAIAGLVARYGGKVIEIPDDKPKGWDCADAIAEGWGRDEIIALCASATVHGAAALISVDPSGSDAPPVPEHDTERHRARSSIYYLKQGGKFLWRQPSGQTVFADTKAVERSYKNERHPFAGRQELDAFLYQVQTSQALDYAGSMPGYCDGLHEENGQRFYCMA